MMLIYSIHPFCDFFSKELDIYIQLFTGNVGYTYGNKQIVVVMRSGQHVCPEYQILLFLHLPHYLQQLFKVLSLPVFRIVFYEHFFYLLLLRMRHGLRLLLHLNQVQMLRKMRNNHQEMFTD